MSSVRAALPLRVRRWAVLLLASTVSPAWPQQSGGETGNGRDRAIGLQVLERNLDALDRLLQGLAGKSPDDAVAEMVRGDLRGTLFQLETVARLYTRQEGDEFDRLRVTFKRGEDALGRLLLAQDLLALADRLPAPELSSFFATRCGTERAAVLGVLDELGLLQEPGVTVDRLRETVRTREWPPRSLDQAFLVERMRAELTRLNSEVSSLAFDNADVELGLHELRREVRWIGIEIQALDGFVVAEREEQLPAPVAAWIAELESGGRDILKSKFARPSPTVDEHPIRIPQRMYALLSEVVRATGDVKDLAETQIHFERALVELELSAARHTEVMDALLAHQELRQLTDHRSVAVAYQQQLRKTDLLGELERWLRDHN